MEQWLILCHVANAIQYDRHPRNFYNLDIKTEDLRSQKKSITKKRKDKF